MQTNPHLKQSVRDLPIVATLVDNDHQRLRCLPAIAGKRCIVLENTIYAVLGQICASYHGGYWDFYQLSNGGFYMAPDSDAMLRLSCANYFNDDVSANTAGIIATATAYSTLSFLNDGECFAIAYHRLSDFIFQHRDAGLIRAALD